MIFALIGNQNCGKTTLFNLLTGSNQHVGNFPGVTVEQKSGAVRGMDDCLVVDLPGIYSLRPYSSEEVVTRDFLLNSKPDAIINIIDATNIERSLYLSLQLMEMHIPMVLVLNMMDEVIGNGGSIDIKLLSQKLGIPVAPISAANNTGIDQMLETVIDTAQKRIYPSVTDFCEPGPVHRCIHAVALQVEDHAAREGMPARFAATKVIENDTDIVKRLALNQNELELIEHSAAEMEQECGMDRNAAMADMRYNFIEQACRDTVIRVGESKEFQRSLRIDRVLTGRYTALPIFLGVMLLIFWLTFGLIGGTLADWLAVGIDMLTAFIDRGLTNYGINPVVHSMIIDGICTGVGSVLSFLPLIVVLFFFLSILEDTGYMARVAFFMDKPMRKIGLSGRSIAPMIIGFGCSVPAIMASRTLSSRRDRIVTILLIPYMSCSAKIPVYAIFAAAFCPDYAAIVMMILYVSGILLGIIAALLLKKLGAKEVTVPFIMELPNYRMPSSKSVLLLMWSKAKDFLERAFTVIFVATLIIWFLQTFDLHLNVAIAGDSILARIGRWLVPLFTPLGFGDWRIVTSLIAGFTAKEALVSTMGVLLGTGMADLPAALSSLFTPLSAASMLVFTLLYTPCVATIAVIRQELGTRRAAIGVVIMQCGVAWVMAWLVYHIGGLL